MLFLWIDLRRTCHHSEGSAVESGRQKGEETILPFLFFEYIDVTRAQGRGKTWHALSYQLKHASFHQSILYRNKMIMLSGSSSGDPNPCRYGVPALGHNQNKLICGPVDSSQCPKGHYCHIGENPATTACCEGSGLSNRCLLSVNKGEGNSLITRFYYEVNEKRCKKFIYKGIRGNENNFLTMEECEDECIKSLNICLLPLINGERKECNN
uniref:BPTI/Kunitz inhibitor domain-containing protein n=1 Tax=Ascaris lumbricoides TaxID=6252 RepID=A0A0M3HH42_ASCLU